MIVLVVAALSLGLLLALIQPGDWLIGWLAFSFLCLLSFWLFTLLHHWTGGGR
jgi:hypothetical protein